MRLRTGHRAVSVRPLAIVGLCTLAWAFASTTAFAEEAAMRQYDVESDTLSKVLKTFAKQSHVQIAFSPEIVGERQAKGIRGHYEPRQALELLLKDSGLSYHYVSEKLIVIEAPDETSQWAPGSRQVRYAQLKESASAATPANRNAAGQSAASSAAAPVPALEEIIVTATKREERLQDISVAVTAFSADRLQDTHVVNLKDLQSFVPSFTFRDDFAVAKIFMRGLGLNTIFGNIDPSVGLYVDGAVINTPAAQFFSMFDLQRVEVLRGPQGTLFGRNTTGGAINLITAKPTNTLEAYARVTAGKYALVQTEGAVSGPLASRILGRLAWQTVSRNGFGINEVTGSEVDNANKKSLRAHLQFNASEDLDFRLTGEYATEDDRAFVFKFKRETFPDTPGQRAVGRITPEDMARGVFLGFPEGGPRNIAQEFDPENDRDTWSVTHESNWRANERFSVRNILNYRDVNVELVQDLDFSAKANREDVTGNGTTNQRLTFNNEQFSEELQLHYDGTAAGRRLSAIAGFYFFKEDIDTANTVGLTPLQGRARIRNGEVTTDKRVQLLGEGRTTSWALFWNARYAVMPELTLKAGGRFTHDKRSVENTNLIFVGGGFGPQLSIAPFDDEITFDEYTNEAGIEWRPQDDILLFYTYSEGFKAGTAPSGSTAAQGFVKPEEIQNNEFGLKTQWFNRRLTVNIQGFFYDAKDLQLQVSIPGGEAGFISRFQNAADQKAHGIELETSWIATDRLRFSGSVSWLKAEFQEGFVAVDPTNPEILTVEDPADAAESLAGNVPRMSPEWSANVHGAYDFPLPDLGGVLTLSGDLSYTGAHFFDEFNSPFQRQDDYIWIDARIRYVADNARWTAEIWGKNLTDELVESGNRALGTGLAIGRTFREPLTWGGTVGFRF